MISYMRNVRNKMSTIIIVYKFIIYSYSIFKDVIYLHMLGPLDVYENIIYLSKIY